MAPCFGRRIGLQQRVSLVAALVSALALSLASGAGTPVDSTERVLAASGSKAYVGLFKENAVAVVDAASHVVLNKVAVPTGPHGIAVTPDGRKVYVASDGATTVSVIDTSSDTVTRTIEVGKAPHGVTTTPDGRLLLVGVWGENQVAFVDTATDQVVRRSMVGAAHNIAVTPDGSQAYVGSQVTDAPALVRISVATGDTIATIPMEGAPRGITISPDGAWLYVTRAGADDVLAIDTTSDQERGRITIGPSPHLPTFVSNEIALVDSQGLGQIFAINTGSRSVTGQVGVGERPHWTAIGPDGGTAFQTNEASNTVSVVNLATLTVSATIPIGEAPRKIVVLPTVSGAGSTAPGQAASASTSPDAPASTSAVPNPTIASGPAPAGAVEARIELFRFGPPVAIVAGQTATWINADSTTHTVTGNDGAWQSGNLEPGRQFSRTFDSPGEYPYFCELHSYMRGTVTVQ